MKKSTRRVVLLLCFALLFTFLASCAESKAPNKDVNFNGDYYDNSTREKTKGNLPDNIDLDGETVGIFYSSFLELSVEGEDEDTDMVYTSIYDRNLKVENWLNMKFNFIPSDSGHWNDIDEEVSNTIYTDDGSVDIVIATSNSIIQQKLYPLVTDLNNSLYLELNQDWWNLNAIKETSLDGRIYEFLYGDLLLSSITGCGAIFYNKDLYEMLNPEKGANHQYTLVQSKEWTLDYFYYLTNRTYVDRDGDQERSNGDIYGFQIFGTAEPIHYFANSAGVEYYKRNKIGFPEITINSAHSIEFCELLEKVFWQNNGANIFYPDQLSARAEHETDFTDGEILFKLGTLGDALAEEMRSMEDDYGIIPYPLGTENQEEYVTLIANGAAVVCVPNTVVKGNDYDRLDNVISAVLEAMSIESYRSVTEKFYELALKSSYTRDDIASDMIDLIVNTSTKNFIYEYSSSLSWVGNIFSNCMSSMGTLKFSTRYAQIEVAAHTALSELIENYLRIFG